MTCDVPVRILGLDMKPLSLTALRKQLYRVIDRVLATGIPVEVERNGRRVLIMPTEGVGRKLTQLKKRDGIIGDPETLVDISVSEWSEPKNLS